jgi:hypothetical protein
VAGIITSKLIKDERLRVILERQRKKKRACGV